MVGRDGRQEEVLYMNWDGTSCAVQREWFIVLDRDSYRTGIGAAFTFHMPSAEQTGDVTLVVYRSR